MVWFKVDGAHESSRFACATHQPISVTINMTLCLRYPRSTLKSSTDPFDRSLIVFPNCELKPAFLCYYLLFSKDTVCWILSSCIELPICLLIINFYPSFFFCCKFLSPIIWLPLEASRSFVCRLSFGGLMSFSLQMSLS